MNTPKINYRDNQFSQTYCARNFTAAVPQHTCTGGGYCKGHCRPGELLYKDLGEKVEKGET